MRTNICQHHRISSHSWLGSQIVIPSEDATEDSRPNRGICFCLAADQRLVTIEYRLFPSGSLSLLQSGSSQSTTPSRILRLHTSSTRSLIGEEQCAYLIVFRHIFC